ncbi:hypothetical protein [Paenibacillus flagellatus]|uniref:Uncharacterized protein n=1 Tax=Paenibacillus flagellatus TaxID=2211139 RepID=A0A2V5JVA5_9BACL|nr:hypothetical protein [Paenibacillus flagellatus]PYI50391.1 hypothetical protein DLM86_29550 [Paenibacillus flagellatus]
MIGTVRWNIVLGASGFILTFLLSIGNNFFLRTLLNSLYSFLILFAVAYALRWILGTLVGLKPVAPETDAAPAEALGRTVDAVTPENEDQLNDLLKEQLNRPDPDATFAPLEPKKLASIPDASGEELARAVRRLTEE